MSEKTFDPDVVLRSLRRMLDTFEESGCKDEALLCQFSKLISQIKTHRWQDFSRKQRWQLDQLQSEVEQKWQPALESGAGGDRGCTGGKMIIHSPCELTYTHSENQP